MKSGGIGDGWCSRGTERAMLGVILLPALNFCVMACRSAILDTVMDIDVGVDALVNVMRRELVNLLVGIAVVVFWPPSGRGGPPY